MSRVAEGTTLAILSKLEPEAKAGWEEELLNLSEAIAASAAITNRAAAATQATLSQATADAQTIKLAELAADNPTVYSSTPPELRGRYEYEP